MTTKSPPGHTGTTSSATNANSTTKYQIYIVLLGLLQLVASEKSVGRTIAWPMSIVIEGSFSSRLEFSILTVSSILYG